MTKFGVLGPVLADPAGTGTAILLPAKQRIVLACLLLSANRVVPLDRLIHALWPEPPRTARITTQGYVKDLRNALGDDGKSRIVTTGGGYRFVAHDGELDLHLFGRLRDAGAAEIRAGKWADGAAKLREAIALWRGEPLLDVPSALLQCEEVPTLTETWLQVTELRVAADLRLGRHDDLTAELRALTAAHPLREKFHEQLMLALYRCGRHAEAIDAYRQVRRLLAGELGIDPGPELRDLHQRMLAGDPGLRAASTSSHPEQAAALGPPRQLPAAVTDFTGRSAQVKTLLQVLDRSGGGDPAGGNPDSVVICVITGAGGVGKTTLAVHIAHQLAPAFPDGQLYASLHESARPVPPGIVLGRFLGDLGLPDQAIPADEAGRAARYRSLLAGRRLLVVLDDAHELAQVRPLIPGSPGCAVVITSRQAIPDLAGADMLVLDGLDDDSALSMFTRIVGRERAMREPDAADEVLGYCGGLPLAIRIAATRLASRPAWSVASLAARLAGERDRLSELAVGSLAVRSSFAVSYQALRAASPLAAELFVLLGLTGMTAIGLGAAAALSGRPERETGHALELLTDAHLVDNAGPASYRVHDLLRIYAAELVEQGGNAEHGGYAARRTAMRRMLEWYCERAVASGSWSHAPYRPPGTSPAFVFGSPQQAVHWCETELTNLVVATRRAAELDMPDLAARIPAGLWWFFQSHPFQDEWLATHETGLTCARQCGDAYTEAFLLNSLGKMHARAGRFADAHRCLTEALAIRRDLGDPTGEGRVLNTIGAAGVAAGNAEQALGHLQQALAIALVHGAGTDVAIVSNNIAEAYRVLGRHVMAITHLQRAISLFREADDHYGEAIAETTAGEICADLGHVDAAIRHYERAVAVANPEDVARADVLDKLAQIYADTGLPARAVTTWQEALAIFDRYRDPRADGIRARLATLASAFRASLPG